MRFLYSLAEFLGFKLPPRRSLRIRIRKEIEEGLPPCADNEIIYSNCMFRGISPLGYDGCNRCLIKFKSVYPLDDRLH